MNKIAQKAYDIALPIAESMGLEIWDVEYLKEAGQWFLRVYIDKAEGVSINDCEDFSKAMSPALDEADPIESSYVFEVSSAGAERELKRPSDFERFMGSFVEVRLYKARDGQKTLTGHLCSYNDDGTVTIKSGDEEIAFPKGSYSAVKLRIEF